jgi:5,10-methylenetetrahydrofolate reductase
VSKLAARLRAGRLPVLLEISPPGEPRPPVLLRRARLLGDRADAVTVIHRPGDLATTPKLRAGASFVQSQPVFSIEGYRELAEEVKSRVPGTLLVPMLMPLVSVDAAERGSARTGSKNSWACYETATRRRGGRGSARRSSGSPTGSRS